MIRSNPYVVHMYELYEELELIIFITELVEGGDLYKYMKENKRMDANGAVSLF